MSLAHINSTILMYLDGVEQPHYITISAISYPHYTLSLTANLEVMISYDFEPLRRQQQQQKRHREAGKKNRGLALQTQKLYVTSVDGKKNKV